MKKTQVNLCASKCICEETENVVLTSIFPHLESVSQLAPTEWPLRDMGFYYKLRRAKSFWA